MRASWTPDAFCFHPVLNIIPLHDFLPWFRSDLQLFALPNIFNNSTGIEFCVGVVV